MRNERLVVTLATIPSRISKLRPVIDSLKAQTKAPDCLYLCICEFCAWERSSYDVPDWLLEDDDVCVVVSQNDYGPANKLLGMLSREPDPSTRIVIVDDDWLYEPGLLASLDERFEHYHRTAAVGLSGARLPRSWSEIGVRVGPEIRAEPQMRHQLIFVAEPAEDFRVDILQFGFGAMVLRAWFDDAIYALVRPLEPLFFSDDVMFSGYLESRGVDRICIAHMPLPCLLSHSGLSPLSGDGRMTSNYKAAIPAISTRLGIWSVDECYEIPRPPFASVLVFRGKRAVRKAYRAVSRIVSGFGRAR